jgi:4-hydroxy-3-polyprenylbenzoate decarboxylase
MRTLISGISPCALCGSFQASADKEPDHRTGRSTPLDPSLPIESREITSRIIIDATITYEWKEKPIPIDLDPEMVKKVKAKWSSLGF